MNNLAQSDVANTICEADDMKFAEKKLYLKCYNLSTQKLKMGSKKYVFLEGKYTESID